MEVFYPLILVLQLVLLFITSQQISRSIFMLSYLMTRSKTLSKWVVASVFFPGTVIHEFSHWIMAKITFVHTGYMEFFPELHGDGLKLGSVQVAKSDPLRRFLIGVAPVIVGSIILFSGLYFFTDYLAFDLIFQSLQNFLILMGALYLTFVISNTMFSSRKDMEGALALGIFFAFVLTIIFVAGRGEWILWLVDQFLQHNQIQTAIQRLNILLIIPLSINLLIVGLFMLVKKRILR